VLTAHMTKTKPADTNPQAKPASTAGTAKPPTPAGPPGNNDESSRISRVDAQGNVVVSTPTDVGRGDYGVYNTDTGIVTLLGNVTISRGENAIRGQYAVVDLNNNVSRMLPAGPASGAPPARVEGLFVRQDQAGASNPSSGNPGGGPPPAGAQKP
jgi:lipopolysaccharide export system protein LptA